MTWRFGPIYQGLSADEVRMRECRRACGAVRMEAYADRVSHHLSMGEKKGIAIATVLVHGAGGAGVG